MNSAKIFALISNTQGGERYASLSLLQSDLIKSIFKIKFLTFSSFPLANRFSLFTSLYHNTSPPVLSHKLNLIYTTSLLRISRLNSYGVPIIYHFHGFQYLSSNQYLTTTISSLAKLLLIPYFVLFYIILNALENLGLNKVVHCVFVDPASRRHFLNRYPRAKNIPFTYISNGVDTNLFCPLATSPNSFFFFCGRLSPEKGVQALIEFAKGSPYHKFVIAYPPNHTAEERTFLCQIEKLPNFTVRANLKTEQLAKFYQQAILTILPSFTEQFPLSYLESTACGTPVISTGVGALRKLQIKIDPHLLISVPSAQYIDQAARYFLGLNFNQQTIIRNRCRRLSLKYSWKDSRRSLRQLFGNLVALNPIITSNNAA